MAFMQAQITSKQAWVEIETSDGGTTYVLESDAHDTLQGDEGSEAVGMVSGYGARLSAPGYMDCTDWAVFDTVQEAADYLLDTYYDRADDEMDDDERQERAGLEELAKS